MHADKTDFIPPTRGWPRKFVAGAMATFVVIFAIVLVNLATHRGQTSGVGSGSRTPIPPTPALTPCILPTPGPQSSIQPTPGPSCISSTPAPGAQTPITGIATTRSPNPKPGCEPIVMSQHFLTDDPFCIFIWLNGTSKAGDEIEFRWFLNGQDITSHDHLEKNAITISQPHQRTIFFGMTYTDPGDGKVEVSYNGTLAFIETFSVAPNPNIPTPPVNCIPPTPSPGNPYPRCTPTPPPTPTIAPTPER